MLCISYWFNEYFFVWTAQVFMVGWLSGLLRCSLYDSKVDTSGDHGKAVGWTPQMTMVVYFCVDTSSDHGGIFLCGHLRRPLCDN